MSSTESLLLDLNSKQHELTTAVFRDYLAQPGIQHQLSVAYTPQQNVVDERMNRTLIDLVQSMLHSRNMEKPFWV